MVLFENKFSLDEICTDNLEAQKNDLFAKMTAQKDSGKIGYYTIFEKKGEFIEKLTAYEESNKLLTKDKIKDIVVIGIGGSSLGTKAIDSLFYEKSKHSGKTLHFLENGDPVELEKKCSKIDHKDSLFLIISKSGGTIETISIFKYILEKFDIDLSEKDAKYRLVFITELDSSLASLGYKYQIPIFEIPKNVGGRFSVLSNVGIVPLYLAGYNVSKLLEGAEEFSVSFFNKNQDHLLEKAIYYKSLSASKSINVLFSYSSYLKYFNEWYVQLWGESLGKIDKNGQNVGLTPIGLVGSVDQHSFLQLIMEGPRDKSVTFIKVANFKAKAKIPNIELEFLESTNYANGSSFEKLISSQCDATMEALLEKKDVPVDEIVLEELNLKNIGVMMYYYELLTSAMGVLFDIDTYNQPGVEMGKKILQGKF